MVILRFLIVLLCGAGVMHCADCLVCFWDRIRGKRWINQETGRKLTQVELAREIQALVDKRRSL